MFIKLNVKAKIDIPQKIYTEIAGNDYNDNIQKSWDKQSENILKIKQMTF